MLARSGSGIRHSRLGVGLAAPRPSLVLHTERGKLVALLAKSSQTALVGAGQGGSLFGGFLSNFLRTLSEGLPLVPQTLVLFLVVAVLYGSYLLYVISSNFDEKRKAQTALGWRRHGMNCTSIIMEEVEAGQIADALALWKIEEGFEANPETWTTPGPPRMRFAELYRSAKKHAGSLVVFHAGIRMGCGEMLIAPVPTKWALGQALDSTLKPAAWETTTWAVLQATRPIADALSNVRGPAGPAGWAVAAASTIANVAARAQEAERTLPPAQLPEETDEAIRARVSLLEEAVWCTEGERWERLTTRWHTLEALEQGGDEALRLAAAQTPGAGRRYEESVHRFLEAVEGESGNVSPSEATLRLACRAVFESGNLYSLCGLQGACPPRGEPGRPSLTSFCIIVNDVERRHRRQSRPAESVVSCGQPTRRAPLRGGHDRPPWWLRGGRARRLQSSGASRKRRGPGMGPGCLALCSDGGR